MAQPVVPTYDVCVVGAGPVGQTVARELAARGRRVVVLEAGGPVADASANARGRTTAHGDERYGDLTWKTWRAYGGTAWAWAIDLGTGPGVRLAGLEPAVVLRRTGPRRWPLELPVLLALQQRALAGLGIDLGLHDLDVHADPHVPAMGRGRYVFAEAARFTAARLGDGVDVRTDAEVVALVVDEATGDGRVTTVEHRTATGTRASVSCRAVVLAAGAVESARLALLLTERLPGMQGRPLLATGVMDRPRLTGVLTLAGHTPADFAGFALRRQRGAVAEERWCSPPDEVLAGQRSASFVLVPQLPGGVLERQVRGVSRGLLIDLPDRVARRSGSLGSTCTRALTAAARTSYPARALLHRRLLGAGFDLEWAGWGARPWRDAGRWSVTASVEQLPDVANRVELGPVDHDGVRTGRLTWGAPVQRSDVEPALAAATTALSDHGVGHLQWPEEFDSVSSHHLMGTLCFGTGRTSPATPRGLLRGTANVYVAGAALFPTSGHANPTLTALALGLHVADCVGQDLDRTGP